MARDTRTLPKAHLHLHFTGSMRHRTLVELAYRSGVRLPESLRGDAPPRLTDVGSRGWFRFQRLYDIARTVITTPDDVRRLLREAAEDEHDEGSGWMEMQVDPSGYAALFDGMTAFLELFLDAAREAADRTGVGIGVIVAANRTRHPLDARALARLATRYAGQGVVGFGLSNDERRGDTRAFAGAFAIARRAGLPAVPHGGELRGPESVREVLSAAAPARLGHGVRAAEDPRLLAELAERGIGCEVCPSSNVALGVYAHPEDVPVRALLDAGVPVALGADDPLLFGSRLTAQYALARDALGIDDAGLAALARCSVTSSFAPDDVRTSLLRRIEDWERTEA